MSQEQESERTIWDFLADLLSGRVQNTLVALNQSNQALWLEIDLLRRLFEMAKTQHEQELDSLNQGLQTLIEKLQGGFDTMKARIEELKSQAQSPQPATPPVEEIDDELATMQGHLDQLNNLATQVSESGATTQAGGAGDVAVPSDTPITPVTPPSGTPDPTPLAGETGPTNPNAVPGTDAGSPEAAAPAGPGTDSGASGVPVGSVAGDEAQPTPGTTSATGTDEGTDEVDPTTGAAPSDTDTAPAGPADSTTPTGSGDVAVPDSSGGPGGSNWS